MGRTGDRCARARSGIAAAVIVAWGAALGSSSAVERVRAEPSVVQEPAHDAAAGADDADRLAAALTQRTCKDQCHTEDRITETRRAAFEWARLVLDMEARGARATEDEFAVIQRYLQRHYGFVNVNRASASELRTVLGLDQTVAAAVVDHRKRNGPFTDLAGLAEVPGVDRKALDTQADAIRFN